MSVLMFQSVVLFGVGASIGSFLARYAYRSARGIKQLFANGNYCDRCGKELNLLRTMPIIGFLISRGKCFNCRYRYGYTSFISEYICGMSLVLVNALTESVLWGVFFAWIILLCIFTVLTNVERAKVIQQKFNRNK